MMNDMPSEPRRAKPDLAAALRAARLDEADRTEGVANVRTLALARLELLKDALAPVLAQVPHDIDLFDVGLMPSEPPRLFIDMIAFVEMGHDRRDYRFFQDRRYGRVLLAKAETLDDAVDAVTAYVARRLVERDKALAADSVASAGIPNSTAKVKRRRSGLPHLPGRGAGWRAVWQVFWFVVEVLGLLVLFGLTFLGLRALVTTILSQ